MRRKKNGGVSVVVVVVGGEIGEVLQDCNITAGTRTTPGYGNSLSLATAPLQS